MSKYSLLIHDPVSGNTQQVPLPEEETLIGADPNAGIPLLDDPTVSYEHCKLICDGETVLIKNESQTNGTFIKVDQEMPIMPGQTLLLGRTQMQLIKEPSDE